MSKIIATIDIDDGLAPDFADQVYHIEDLLNRLDWVKDVKAEEG